MYICRVHPLTPSLLAFTLGALTVLTACGAGGEAPAPDAPAADAGDGTSALLEAAWSVPAGKEGYLCIIKTVPEDTYVKEFIPELPPGTHHTILAHWSPTDGQPTADGTYYGDGLGDQGAWCTGFTAGANMIYASSVGTPPLAMPPGIATKLRAGDKIILNLHLFNPSDHPLEGVTGVRARMSEPVDDAHLAEPVLMGSTINLQIPASVTGYDQQGTCTITNQAIHIFSVVPHMHNRGKHLKTAVQTPAGTRTIFDRDYAFEEQVGERKDPEVVLQPGDALTTTCTYDNPSPTLVRFGEHANDEMCFTVVFYYPAQNHRPICDDARP